MKKHLIALALIFGAMNVSAQQMGNEGPNATPTLPQPQVLAEIVVNIGFHPPSPNFPSHQNVVIMPNGVVWLYLNSADGPVASEFVTQLSPEILQKVREWAAAAPDSELVPVDPKAPQCMDAPSTTFYAHNGTKRVEIGGKFGCKDYVTAAYGPGNRDLVKLLEVLMSVARN